MTEGLTDRFGVVASTGIAENETSICEKGDKNGNRKGRSSNNRIKKE